MFCNCFLSIGNSDPVLVPVSIDFLSTLKGDAPFPFHHIVYDYACGDFDGPCDHFRDVLSEYIFKLGASVLHIVKKVTSMAAAQAAEKDGDE